MDISHAPARYKKLVIHGIDAATDEALDLAISIAATFDLAVDIEDDDA